MPTEKHAGNLLVCFTQTQISTMAVKDRFLVAGDFQGEIVCKCLDKPGVSFCTRITYEDNAITNAVEIYESISGGLNFMASNDDCGVREYNMEKYELINQTHFPWPVNHTWASSDRRLLAVGENLDRLLVDAHNRKTVASVVGHLDYTFATAWHPEGHICHRESLQDMPSVGCKKHFKTGSSFEGKYGGNPINPFLVGWAVSGGG